jgi:hypothetical protein
MAKIKEPNPLNFFEARQSTVPPSYFEYLSVPGTYNMEAALVKWISQNLRGRFYVGRTVEISSKTNRIESVIRVGFEDGKELAYFMLACPLLKY